VQLLDRGDVRHQRRVGDAVSDVVLVRQFLKPGATREFDEVFREHHQLVSKRDGFVSLRWMRPAKEGQENDVVVILEFASEEQLRSWRASAEHARVAERYRTLWARDPVTEFFIIDSAE
jgi:heme-degrading monooxygenase HmoA